VELLIIVILNLVSGVFALSEIALVSVKKQRMIQLAEGGDSRARIVLDLLKNPESFLSAVQIGITLIGIVSGVFGGATLTDNFRPVVEKVAWMAPYANQIAYTLVVAMITYLSIVIGELIPKTIAMKYSEGIALNIAGFIQFFARLSYPFVWLLTKSTNLVTNLLGIKPAEEEKLTEEELRYVIKTAGRQGLLDKEESDLHQNVLTFTELKAKNVMTHRLEVEWIDITDSPEAIEKQLRESNHFQLPVCDDGYDNMLGYLLARDYFMRKNEPQFNLRSILREPVYIPENLYAIDVLQQFKKRRCYFGIVVDEFGAFEGVITLRDLSEALIGDLPDNEIEPAEIIRRSDGSLLVNGSIAVSDLNQYLDTELLPENNTLYATLAGFILHHLERIPDVGEQFEYNEQVLEILDKDGARIDKVLLKSL
jgi:putative hemolysin